MKEPARILAVELRAEDDLVLARHRAREIAVQLGFPTQDGTRIATAVSEIARNAFRYAVAGRVAFAVDGNELVVTVTDRGKGIDHLQEVLDGTYVSTTGMGMGLVGARRLVDDLQLTTSTEGTTVVLRKRVPGGKAVDSATIGRLSQSISRYGGLSAYDEMQFQNQELVRTLDELRERNSEVERLNQELADTNRGVLALYAELDEKAESLRRASDLKTRFLSNMSHEFRTPLNSILSITGLLDMEVDGTLTAEQRRQIDYVRSSARALIEMVNDLLDIAKIEAGKSEVRPATFRLPEFFAALRGMFRPLMTGDRVTLDIEQPPDVSVRTDEAKLSQIVRNFVSNAIKYTSDGTVRVWSEIGGGSLTISVRDSGIGIPPQYHHTIFEEFIQVENPLQKKAKGTGLGLPLTRRLAELLGGRVAMESRLGEGSTFHVTIPVELVSTSGGPRPPLPPEEVRARVLIIDDDETARYVLRSMLPAGCAVEEAPDGPEGVVKAKEEHPDIIFVDVLMPTMNGIEVVKRLRHDPVTAPIPVVVRTSKTLTAEERRTLEEEGALSILGKTHLSVERSMEELRAIFRKAKLLTP
jgi:signal transduction histidine kinase/CheY-like chemotaxis protein